MPFDALAIAPAILAVVLAVSAVGKLRAPSASREAFRDLKVPAALRRPAVVSALPWVELLLALGLLLAGGVPGVVVALAALGLFLAYLALVVRALGFEVPVNCACFGEFAPGRISRATVIRNAWLVGLSVLALVRSGGSTSVLGEVVDDRAPWWWLGAAAAAAVTVALVAVRAITPTTEAAPAAPLGVEEDDYLRVRTPALPVTLGDGTVTNPRALSAQRPQLLLYVSDWCSSC
ncbi:MAG: hypothetical protein JWP82_391, partial [Humibacillus sp.]|nr:hypothetical protein [Humibacillus sp.]